MRRSTAEDYRGKVGFEVKVETSPTTVKLGGTPGEERELKRETYVLFTERDSDDQVLLEQQKRQKACAVVGEDLKVTLERWQGGKFKGDRPSHPCLDPV